MIVECSFCKIAFGKSPYEVSRGSRHYCSRSCAAKKNNVGKQRNPPVGRVCNKCSSSYIRVRGRSSENLCEACYIEYKNRSQAYMNCTLADYQSMPSVAGKHPSWINSHVRSFARSWNSHLTKIPCQKCGYSKHVELCHIIPISQWPKTARLGDVNHQDNLLALCRNHHWEFDHKHLALSDIPQRN